uniref:Putative tick transposon n=1 Tax=Ixodes ricinus TaxID=34613 RepID=A0A147BCI9_IXORI
MSSLLVSRESRKKWMTREALLAILSSLLYLSTQGLAIRGHEDTESNLRQLLELRANDIPSLQSWLQRTKYKWISHQILNETLELMAHDVLRSLTDEVREAEHYSVILDETADISAKEQLSVCFRVVTENFEVQELFCGFFSTADTTAASLFTVLKDILCRFNLQVNKCRGQCYDGAANMGGKHRGVQALMQEEEPRALYVHCLAHVLNLVLQDVSQKVDMCRDLLYFVTELINFVTCSPKRVALFQELQREEDVNLRKFCPTRWTLKAASLRSVLLNYESLITFLRETASEERNEAGAKASGLLKMLYKFDTFFVLKLLTMVFSRMEALNTALQKRTLRFHEAEKMVKAVNESITELRQTFSRFWEEALEEADKVDVEDPSVTVVRQKKTPRRYEEGSAAHVFPSVMDMYRQRYNEVLDTVLSSLRNRYPPGVWQHMAHIEQFAIGNEDLTYVTKFYGDDLEPGRLLLHRDMLIDIVKQHNPAPLQTFHDVVQIFSGDKGQHLRNLLPEMAKLIKIALTIPVTSCTSERSFSCLRRLKTYLRSTMGQTRLNHLALLHTHKELSRKINLNDVADEFISRSSVRMNTFSTSAKSSH